MATYQVDTEDGHSYEVETEDSEPISNIPKNAVNDVKGMIQGTAHQGLSSIDPFGLGEAALKGSTEPIQRKTMEPLNQVIGLGKQIGQTVAHPWETFKQHPVNTAALATAVVDPIMGAIGRGGEAASVASKAVPEAPPQVPIPENVASLAIEGAMKSAAERPAPPIEPLRGSVEPPPPPIPPKPSAFEQLKSKIPEQIVNPAEELTDYLKKQYGKVSEKPGFAGTLGDLLLRKANVMRLKEVGFTPGQIRKLVQEHGEENVFKLGQFAKEKGITDEIVGHKVGENIQKLNKQAGGDIGAFRKAASERGAVHNPVQLVQSIRDQLDPIYLGKGVHSAQKASYLKALKDIENASSTPEKLASKITELNEFATKNKMIQAPGAISDVANAATRANNELMSKYLNTEEMADYRQALKDFGTSKVLEKGYAFKVGREFGGRAGPSHLWNWAKDLFGNKFMEKISDGLGAKLKADPNIVKSPKVLTDEILNQMAATLDEIGDEFVQ